MKPLRLTVDRVSGEMAALRMEGDFEGVSAVEAQEELLSLVDGMPERSSLWLDLSGIAYIDSTAIGILIEMAKKASAGKVDFGLFNVREDVRKVIKVTHVDKIIKIQDKLG